MQTIFWIIALLISTHYLLFGAFVFFMGLFAKKKERMANSLPSVSFIVAAYNEEKIIAEKIKNLFCMDYPEQLIEFIITSDGSTDSTPKIVESAKEKRLVPLYNPERRGKTHALNRAVKEAKNDILIFSDANSMFRPNAIKELVKHFYDPNIGGVCGRKSVLFHEKRKASLGDKLFWHYESAIKSAESVLGSIPTADGEIFAVRKEFYSEIPDNLINDDMAITFTILKNKKRVIYEKEAITEEEASLTLKDDFNVKARMVYGGIQAIKYYSDVLNPLTSWFGFQFFFHKTLRYFMWFLLVTVFISNSLCYHQHFFYKSFFHLQLIFYAMALVGFVMDKFNRQFKLFYLPYYYCNVNIAAFRGFIFYLKKESGVNIWTKAQR